MSRLKLCKSINYSLQDCQIQWIYLDPSRVSLNTDSTDSTAAGDSIGLVDRQHRQPVDRQHRRSDSIGLVDRQHRQPVDWQHHRSDSIGLIDRQHRQHFERQHRRSTAPVIKFCNVDWRNYYLFTLPGLLSVVEDRHADRKLDLALKHFITKYSGSNQGLTKKLYAVCASFRAKMIDSGTISGVASPKGVGGFKKLVCINHWGVGLWEGALPQSPS